MYEVEVKAHLRNREEVMKKLQSFGCEFGEELHQIDHVYFPEGLAFPPPIGTGILRVRKQGEKYFFTLKISQSGRQDSLEREMEIKDGEMMMEIIKLLKYQEAPTVNKKRIKTKYKDMVIELDEVEELGEFIEVEKIVTNENHADRQKIQRELGEFLESLGISKEDLLPNYKYDIMLFEKLGKK